MCLSLQYVREQHFHMICEWTNENLRNVKKQISDFLHHQKSMYLLWCFQLVIRDPSAVRKRNTIHQRLSLHTRKCLLFMGWHTALTRKEVLGESQSSIHFLILLAISCPCLCCMWERETLPYDLWDEKCEKANKWFSPPSQVNVPTLLLQQSYVKVILCGYVSGIPSSHYRPTLLLLQVGMPMNENEEDKTQAVSLKKELAIHPETSQLSAVKNGKRFLFLLRVLLADILSSLGNISPQTHIWE